MVIEQGYSIAEAVKSLVVGTSVLYKWKEKFEVQRQGITLEESERDEMKRLRRENKVLSMEKKILKKAIMTNTVALISDLK